MQTEIVSFDVSEEDAELCRRIADRAVTLARRTMLPLNLTDVLMDVEATHANGCKLRLAELLAADDFNFSHDVFGIKRHLDRTTGKLTGFFVPRFAIQ